MRKLNTLLTGIFAGIVLPAVIFVLLYYAKFSSLRFIEFPKQMLMGTLLPLVLSWCILPNLLLFFIFNWTDWLKAAKGVLASTVVITLMLFGLKVIYSLI